MSLMIVGIAWYTRENYPRVLEVMSDAHLLPHTYDDWLSRAITGEKQLQQQGRRVVRAEIDAERFVAWCRERSLNVDAKARMEYANTVAVEHARR